MHFLRCLPISIISALALLIHGQEDCASGYREFRNRDIAGPISQLQSTSVEDLDECTGLCNASGIECRSFLLQEFSHRQATCHLFRNDLGSQGLFLIERVPGSYPRFNYYEKSASCASLKLSTNQTKSSSGKKELPTLVSSEWTQWTECSESCGGGLTIRERQCEVCSDNIEKELKACNLNVCPGESLVIEEVRGRWSAWTGWSDCPQPCEGRQKRYRLCYPGQEMCGEEGHETSEAQTRRCRCARHNFSGTGVWTSWARFAACSVPCGTGERIRTRQCTVPGDCEGTFEKVEVCMEKECVGPQWRDWTEWGPCSASCGEGIRSRSRVCEEEGKCEGEPTAESPCRLQACPRPATPAPFTPRPVINWSPWEEWSPCTASCGLGQRTRNRVCPRGEFCPGQRSQSEDCFEEECPGVDWLPWTDWSVCSASCGPGLRDRSRECPPGSNCPGEATQVGNCNLRDCPSIPRPVWSNWGFWSDCSATCGQGDRRRTRSCPPGGNCLGQSFENEQCFIRTCPGPIAITWEPWQNWGTCSETCGSGTRSRQRVCPRRGQCPGSAQDSERCLVTACPRDWLNWGPWQTCSVTCGMGTRTRNRVCPPGGSCEGSSVETVSCRESICIGATPGWMEWTPWSDCSATCNQGIRRRTRNCPSGSCPGNSFEMENCQLTKCLEAGECQEWTAWSPCSTSCGQDGVQTRIRVCGLDYRPEPEQRPCNRIECGISTVPNWLTWGAWGVCTATCGSGVQSRVRSCSDIGRCGGENEQSRVCNSQLCPTPTLPQWLQWGPWTTCSVSCGTGRQSRERVCSRPRQCFTGNEVESQDCTLDPCPGQPPSWLAWGPWSACTTTCGDLGVQFRSRECSTPGSCSQGQGVERQICDPGRCAEWSIWSGWSNCAATCGIAERLRTRSCPVPRACPGTDTEAENCPIPPCPSANWLNWEPWSQCSATCGAGEEVRIRSCSVPFQCSGQDADSKPCERGPCLFLDWSPWSPWSICSQSCAEGMRARARACPKETLCPGIPREMEMCNRFSCPAAQPPQEPDEAVTSGEPAVQPYQISDSPEPYFRDQRQVAWVKTYGSSEFEKGKSVSPVSVAFIRLKSDHSFA